MFVPHAFRVGKKPFAKQPPIIRLQIKMNHSALNIAPRQPHPYSLIAVHLEFYFNEQALGVSGSGFLIFTKARESFLVTAKHNFTGLEQNLKVKHSMCAVPNLVTLSNFFGILAEKVPLYAGGNQPRLDPLFTISSNQKIDVALLRLNLLEPKEAQYLHESLWRPESYAEAIKNLDVASTCFIIGYPEGFLNRLSDNRVLPIWKVGHVANDPQFPLNGEPVCVIDATTRPGMSGAAVLALKANSYDPMARTCLVGVYSGRTSDSSDLGYVWNPAVIHEILSERSSNW